MTAVDVDALDKLREAATAGEWRVPYPFTKLIDGPETQLASAESAADAALIVAAVNALPDLLAEVRRGRALRERLEGLAARWRSTSSPLGLQLAGDDLYAVLTAVDPS